MHESDPKSLSPFRVRGRAAHENPTGRFETQSMTMDGDDMDTRYEACDPDRGLQVPTQVFTDTARTIISSNESPDIGMEATINPYRGCEHGCIYCYARPTHEYLGLSAGLDFESKIFIKQDAARLLDDKLRSRSWVPKIITLSGVTDPYQPLERKLRITRSCLEVLSAYRNPCVIITKNALVSRDIDIFDQMAAYDGISVNVSITTLDNDLARTMEPRASQPRLRLRAVEMLAQRNIPVGIMIGPVLPGLTDHEIPAILKAASESGARSAHYTMLRLPYGVKDLFKTWLETNYPDKAQKVIHHVQSVRNGKMNDANFGSRMRGEGVYADHVANIFSLFKKKYGLNRRVSLSTNHFRRPAAEGQMDLFS